MKIHIEMSEEEMNDFLQYRREKAGRRALNNRLKDLSETVLRAIECREEGYMIVDQDWAEDLLEKAAMYAQ